MKCVGEKWRSDARSAFGLRLRDLRRTANLSQEDLADKTGLHRTYISSLERGHRNVGFDNIVLMARALDVRVADLFVGVDDV